MEKRVFIVHRWDGHPNDIWFPWLKAALEMKGFMVAAPQLPNPEEPRIQSWVPALAEAVGTVDEHTYFVGHSMGCQTIARYLESLPEGAKVGGAVFVAGFFKRLTNLEDEDIVRDVANEWLTTPLDLEKVKARLGQSVAIFSDDDPYVPLDNQDDFTALGAQVVVEHGQGHFSDGVTELPAALEAVMKIAA